MTVSSQEILEGLNPPQREAVETLNGPLLILAGAGSGKTRVVTRRIANLIAHGVNPWEILAITFTNKAAGEMRHRVEDLVGARGVWLSTFHSFCARLLRREAEVLGLPPEYTIYDEDDVRGILKDVVKELNLDEKRYAPRRVRELVSRMKSAAVEAEEIDGVSFHERIVQQVYKAYQKKLRANGALDFDDLLLLGVKLLREHDDVRARYRERFRHILVDEYQDTNTCQYRLVQLLGKEHQNVCATGDPDQSIYAWRGADVTNILSFERDFPNAKVVRLEQNYRSTGNILKVAGAVIRNNKQRREKELWTENPEGEPIRLKVLGDSELEAYEIAAEISRIVQAGRRYSELAVFYRTNAQSRPFETALIQAAIPYQLVGGTPFYERREVKDALAYLRLTVNPKDDVSFQRIVNVPRRGVGKAALEAVAKRAAEKQVSMLEVLDDAGWLESAFKPAARKGLIAFARVMDELRAMPPWPVEDVLVRALAQSGLKTSLEDQDETERLENVQQLVNAAVVYDTENRPGQNVPAGPPPEPGAFDGLEDIAQRQASVVGFLENAALIQSTDNIQEGDDRVTLMTLHMAKGLEFPYVLIAGMEEGLVPMVRTGGPGGDEDGDREEAALEEERRLFYVGVTRAREELFLYRALRRNRFGRFEAAVPSRFLDEVPAELLKTDDRARSAWADDFSDFDRRPGRKRKAASDFAEFEAALDDFAAPRKRKQAPELAEIEDEGGRTIDVSFSQLDESLEVGDRVQHATFGIGTVEALSGSGLSAKVKVHFRTAGPKLLLMSLAKLKKV